MASEQHSHNQGGGSGSFLRSRTGLALIGFLAIAAFYLATEHTAHFFGYLPFALVLLCPLLHLFMHGGHGGHGGQGNTEDHRGHQANRPDGGQQ